jgi:hypothetical protein
MSYEIVIRSNEDYSEATELTALGEFLKTFPHMQSHSQRQFTYEADSKLYMEIDLETVGDRQDAAEMINCIRVNIPLAYSDLGDTDLTPYYDICLAITQHLGWSAYDQQSGENLVGAQSD